MQEERDEHLDVDSILPDRKKMKQTKEERMADIIEGREGASKGGAAATGAARAVCNAAATYGLRPVVCARVARCGHGRWHGRCSSIAV